MILELDFDKLAKEESSLKSSFVRTRSLPQHREAFHALVQKHGAKIVQLLRDNKGKGYMAVGYKSCVNGREEGQCKHSYRRCITAATQGVVNLHDQADIGMNIGSRDKGRYSTTATMAGEQIFAVRYRKVSFMKGKPVEGVDFGDVQRVSHEGGVFAKGEHDEEFLTEDDTSERGEPESVDAEELLLCGDGDVAEESDPAMVIQSDVNTGDIGGEIIKLRLYNDRPSNCST
ncbi:uncharacterized protein EI97DRAFT_480936 [Westerdykella ornata]|uniref:Uncharacterized protein n=1 Tax=Westerdykella ornata TaxID=318751 RepID=A0A6A6JBE2_WESOR|nr:uncharacterized protein EI97DRAFT_480936 [Westerdykella ornata]KAF2273298.1 hypothetical protein EI97DRAFT_480936 [Westerdykella ornata]